MEGQGKWADYWDRFYYNERIPAQKPDAGLPEPLRKARELEYSDPYRWGSWNRLFLAQAKLLADYESEGSDEAPGFDCYYPTYRDMDDQTLRAYFAWRTNVRRGVLNTPNRSFAFVYIYELLNFVGIREPLEGLKKLCAFGILYGGKDEKIPEYLNRWLADYAVFYDLDPALVSELPQVRREQAIADFARLQELTDQELSDTMRLLAPTWFDRSRFYKARKAEMDRVICGVLRRVYDHYQRRCKRTMAEGYFGDLRERPASLFDGAVFYRTAGTKDRVYALNGACRYRYSRGRWFVTRYGREEEYPSELMELLRGIDSMARQAFGYRYPSKNPIEAKWLLKIIGEEIAACQKEAAAQEIKRQRLDPARLERIRQDAAQTRDRLLVDEEEEPEEEMPPEPELPADTPLSPAEYRYLQCLLYGRDTGWTAAEGHIPSVLADSINEKLFDEFQDTVLELDAVPALVEDYIEELKGMIHP